MESPRRPDRPRELEKKPTPREKVELGIEQLSLFLKKELLVAGDIYFKTSRFQKSRKYHAELRGTSIVVFRSAQIARSEDLDINGVVSVIVVPYYNVNVVQKEQGNARIYISSGMKNDWSLMYIKVRGGSPELDAWRLALAKAKSCPLPSLADLTIESVIGRGGGGKVFMVHWKESDVTYALKVIDKAQAFKSKKSFRHVTSERTLMEAVGKHPFLLQMHFAFQTERNLFIGTPFCHGGDVGSYVRSQGDILKRSPSHWAGQDEKKKRKTAGRLSEVQTRQIAAEIVLGLEHLHSRGIIYRDLKPENVFIDKDGHVKIGDYGLAKHLRGDIDINELRSGSVCGTRNYIAPEMVFGKMYSLHADMWSLGVMLYRMLVGEFPFEAQRSKDLFAKAKNENHRMPSSLSSSAKRLIDGLLQKDPYKRPTIESIREEPFFKGVNWDDVRNLRAGPSIPDLEVGQTPTDALGNFELTRLEGITIGDYVKGGKDEVEINGKKKEKEGKWKKEKDSEDEDEPKPIHLQDLSRMIVGFEFGLLNEDSEPPPPLDITLQKGGSFWKLSSLDTESFAKSPRTTPREPFGFLKSPRSVMRLSSRNLLPAPEKTDEEKDDAEAGVKQDKGEEQVREGRAN